MVQVEVSSAECWLFSYGTLRQPDVQRALFGREVESVPDALPGFEVGTVAISDPAVVAISGSVRHPIAREAGADAVVQGTALLLTEADLQVADAYETADYLRRAVVLKSGRHAFAYVARAEAAE
jgi:hypothetical protein